MIRYRVIDADTGTVVEFHAEDRSAAVAQARTLAPADDMQGGSQRRALRLLEDQGADCWVVAHAWVVGGDQEAPPVP